MNDKENRAPSAREPGFTPGPWRACFPEIPNSDGRRYYPHVHLGASEGGIRECGGHDIVINEGGGDMGTCDANASLIAAAPDLYGALTKALLRLEAMHRWAIGRDADLGWIEEALSASHAALAKATDSQPGIAPEAPPKGDQMSKQVPEGAAKAARSLDGAALIAAERRRQIEVEGWTADHDDEHGIEELARAAACYATPRCYASGPAGVRLTIWPWDRAWWKPGPTRIRELAKAGALIAAEIDRLLRATRDRASQEAPPSSLSDPTTRKDESEE